MFRRPTRSRAVVEAARQGRGAPAGLGRGAAVARILRAAVVALAVVLLGACGNAAPPVPAPAAPAGGRGVPGHPPARLRRGDGPAAAAAGGHPRRGRPRGRGRAGRTRGRLGGEIGRALGAQAEAERLVAAADAAVRAVAAAHPQLAQRTYLYGQARGEVLPLVVGEENLLRGTCAVSG